MDDHHSLIDQLKTAQQQFIQLVDHFPTEKRQLVLFDKWSLKDILAHLTGWNELDTKHLDCLKKNIQFEWITDSDQFNEIEIKKRSSLNWDQMYQSYLNSSTTLLEMYNSLTEDQWHQNNNLAINDLKGMIKHLQDEHIPLIKKFNNDTN